MTTTDIPPVLTPVQEAINEAHAIAWDGCHKIYLAMDAEQAQWFQEHYEITIGRLVMSPLREIENINMMTAITQWWNNSCALRFISAVHTNHETELPLLRFTDLVPQGHGWDDDEDDEWDCWYDDWDVWYDEEEE